MPQNLTHFEPLIYCPLIVIKYIKLNRSYHRFGEFGGNAPRDRPAPVVDGPGL
jgi:hypothetical protein